MSSGKQSLGYRIVAILLGRGGRPSFVVLSKVAQGAGGRAQTWWDRLLIWLADDLFCIPVRRIPGFGKLSGASFFQASLPQDDQLVFRRILLLRALAAVAVVLFVDWLNLFGLSEDSARFSRAAFYQFVEPYYPGTQVPPDGKPPLPAPSVVLLTETDLVQRGETWPASYGLHAAVLEELLDHEPEAVFVDIAFIDERDDDTWEELVQTVCLYQADEVPIFVASPRFIHAFPLADALVEDSVDAEMRRATRIQSLVRAGAIPVAVPGGAFGRDGLVYPFGATEEPIFSTPEESEARTWRADARDPFPHLDERALPRFGEYRERSQFSDDLEISPCSPGADRESADEMRYPSNWLMRDQRHLFDSTVRGEPAKQLFLPSAACALYAFLMAAEEVPPYSRLGWCKSQYLQRKKDHALEVYWRYRSQDEEEHAPIEANAYFHVDNGMPGGCRRSSGLRFIPRFWALLVSARPPQLREAGELLAPIPGPWLRDSCPPFHYLNLAYLLPDFGVNLTAKRDEAVFETVQGKVVMYGVQLVAIWDKVVPPTHVPLPGVFFHAMAYDNLRLRHDAYIGEDTVTIIGDVTRAKALFVFVLLLLALPVEFYKTFVAELARIIRNARLGPRVLAFLYVVQSWALVNAFAITVLVAASWLMFFTLDLSPINFAGVLALLVTYISLDLLSNLRLLTRLSSHVEEADRRRLQKRGGGS